ncbi:MAG: tetratricopeptide repeat protein [Bryobacterales bacterium]|nr:tetratricopeptide repeat protein [Bryobacterales bacterium]
MICRVWASAGAILLLGSCASRMRQTNAVVARPAAVQPAMQRQIENAIDAGDGDVIARQLRERMAAGPDDVNVRLALADHYRKQGYPELALEHYRLAAERFPDNARVALLTAQVLHDQGMTAEAAAGLERFLARYPAKDAGLQAWLGILWDGQGEYAKAEIAHRAAIVLDPSSAKLRNNLGYNLLLQGKRNDALTELRRAVGMDSGSRTARGNLALALMRGGRGEERKEAILQWQSISNPAAAHNNAGAVLLEEGRYVEARKELEFALSHQPAYTPALKNLELLAGLDGKSAALPVRAASPANWKRTMKRLWYAVAGMEETPSSGSVTIATKQ